MNVDLVDGRYVIAVSGGVDSMVLLDILRQKPGIQLIVAHYDHGIRHDSIDDRRLVQRVAREYGLQFIYDEGHLGPDTSEEMARKARYEFLNDVRSASKARAIITAHHENDLIETAIINLLRGTGRKGLTSMKSGRAIVRPLLHVPKAELKKYATDNDIRWREDSTNSDVKYLRNYLRNKVIPNLTYEDREQLLELIHHTHSLNEEIDEILTHALHVQPALDTLERHWFIMLPHAVAGEVMTTWLRRHKVKNIDKKMIIRLVTIARTSPNNRVADIDKDHILRIGQKELTITQRTR